MTAPAKLLDDQQIIRDHFARMSTEIMRRKEDPEREIKSIIYTGLATNHWPLEGLYAIPGFSLVTPQESLRASSELQAFQAISEWGPPPLDATGKIFPGGYAMFMRAVDPDLVPEYYAVPMAQKAMEENIQRFVRIFDGADILELCIGNGINAAERNRILLDAGAKPKSFILSDLVKGVVEENAVNAMIDAGIIISGDDDIEGDLDEKDVVRQFRRAGVDKEIANRQTLNELNDKVVRLSTERLTTKDITILSGDIHSDVFWSQKEFEALRQSEARTVVIIDSQTWNDFSEDKRVRLLQRFQEELKPGSDILILVDSTRRVDKVEPAYNHVFSQQWIVRGFVADCAMVGLAVDPTLIRCRIDVKETNDGVVVMPFIVNLEEQRIKIKVSGHGEMDFILPKGDIPCDEVYKIKEYILKPEFIAAGMQDVDTMQAVDPERVGVRTNWWSMRTRGVARPT